MTFTIHFNAELGIIESTLSGQFTPRKLHAGIISAIARSKETRTCRFLCDLTLVSSEILMVDLYDLPNLFVLQGLSRSARTAVLPPQSRRSKERADFYETVCVNRGWIVKVFEKREAAILWLLNRPNDENCFSE